MNLNRTNEPSLCLVSCIKSTRGFHSFYLLCYFEVVSLCLITMKFAIQAINSCNFSSLKDNLSIFVVVKLRIL